MVSAIIAAANAAAPKIQNLCDRIKCDSTDSVAVCALNGNHYKVFDNACELRKHNCNKGQSKIFIFHKYSNNLINY